LIPTSGNGSDLGYFRGASWRWLLLGIFPVGYWVTKQQLAPEASAYLGWHIIAFCACALLLLRLRTLAAYYWPIWLGLGAFLLGYFVKFYALVGLSVRPSLVVTVIVNNERLQLAGQPDIAAQAFRIAVLAFSVYCAVFFFILRPLGPESGSHSHVEQATLKQPIATFTWVGFALLVVTTIVALRFGILSMAEAQVRLPFRLGGWIMYTRIALITTLGLGLLQFGLTTLTRRWTAAGLLLLLGLGLTDTLVRTSRGALLLIGIMLLLMFALASQKLSRRTILVFVGLGALSIVLYPVITAYRYLNALTGGRATMGLLQDAVTSATQDGSWLSLAIFQVLQRFMGVDILLFITDPTTWIGLGNVAAARAAWGSVADYLTHFVMGVPETTIFSEAPSLVGWFLIVGGLPGILLLFPTFLITIWSLWVRLWDSNLLIKPVAQVQMLVLWLTLSSEGTLDSMTLHVSAIVASLIAVEFWLRSATGYAVSHRMVPVSGTVPSPAT
jgi:hypothetical protein